MSAAAPAVSVRPATDADLDVLRSLADDTRRAEFAILDLPDAALDQLLDMQFEARCRQYRQDFPEAIDHVITVNGEAVGRMLLDESADGIRLIDLAVQSDARGQGVGTAVLRQLIERSERDDVPILLHVVHTNPARHLYQRLGWRLIGFDGVRHAMTRNPAR